MTPHDSVERCYSVREFCEIHRISVSLFYELPIEDRPKFFRVGKRVLISPEAAREWRRRLEARVQSLDGDKAA
jgi:hypothetical protein